MMTIVTIEFLMENATTHFTTFHAKNTYFDKMHGDTYVSITWTIGEDDYDLQMKVDEIEKVRSILKAYHFGMAKYNETGVCIEEKRYGSIWGE